MRPGSETWLMMEVMLRMRPYPDPFMPRHEGAAHEKCRGEARVDDAAEFLEREIDEVLADIDAGVVDEDLRMTESAGDCIRDFCDVFFLVTSATKNSAVPPCARCLADIFKRARVTCHKRDVAPASARPSPLLRRDRGCHP